MWYLAAGATEGVGTGTSGIVFITAVIIWAINTGSEYDARVVTATTTAEGGTFLGSGATCIERLNPPRNPFSLFIL